MRVLTIQQPRASLIVEGNKPFVFRSCATDYRGPVLTHASTTPDVGIYQLLGRPPGDPMDHFIGMVQLVAVHPLAEETLDRY